MNRHGLRILRITRRHKITRFGIRMGVDKYQEISLMIDVFEPFEGWVHCARTIITSFKGTHFDAHLPL